MEPSALGNNLALSGTVVGLDGNTRPIVHHGNSTGWTILDGETIAPVSLNLGLTFPHTVVGVDGVTRPM